jgi:hypothetical protein
MMTKSSWTLETASVRVYDGEEVLTEVQLLPMDPKYSLRG